MPLYKRGRFQFPWKRSILSSKNLTWIQQHWTTIVLYSTSSLEASCEEAGSSVTSIKWQLQRALEEVDYLIWTLVSQAGICNGATLVLLHNDIQKGMDGENATIVLLLVLLAAFDTVDYSSLLDHLWGLGMGAIVLWCFYCFPNRQVQSVIEWEVESLGGLIWNAPEQSSLSHSVQHLNDTPLKTAWKLQLVQNTAAYLLY